jgi:hypothetical protein
VLVEAAWSAAKSPGPLRAFALRTAARRGKNVATVAVARKLCVLRWHLLIDGALKATTNGGSIAWSWNLRRVAAGAHRDGARIRHVQSGGVELHHRLPLTAPRASASSSRTPPMPPIT